MAEPTTTPARFAGNPEPDDAAAAAEATARAAVGPVAALLRQAFVAQYRRAMEVHRGVPCDWGARPMATWDGGITAGGRRCRSVWRAAAIRCIRDQLDPCELVEAVFELRRGTGEPPSPNSLLGDKVRLLYEHRKADAELRARSECGAADGGDRPRGPLADAPGRRRRGAGAGATGGPDGSRGAALGAVPGLRAGRRRHGRGRGRLLGGGGHPVPLRPGRLRRRLGRPPAPQSVPIRRQGMFAYPGGAGRRRAGTRHEADRTRKESATPMSSRKPPQPWTAERHAEVARLYREGKSLEEIAEQVGTSPRQVWTSLKHTRTPMRGGGGPRVPWTPSATPRRPPSTAPA